jgi:hypothetical protein
VAAEKLTRAKLKRQLAETLSLEEAAVQAILGKTIKMYASNLLAFRETNVTLIRHLQAL